MRAGDLVVRRLDTAGERHLVDPTDGSGLVQLTNRRRRRRRPGAGAVAGLARAAYASYPSAPAGEIRTTNADGRVEAQVGSLA